MCCTDACMSTWLYNTCYISLPGTNWDWLWTFFTQINPPKPACRYTTMRGDGGRVSIMGNSSSPLSDWPTWISPGMNNGGSDYESNRRLDTFVLAQNETYRPFPLCLTGVGKVNLSCCCSLDIELQYSCTIFHHWDLFTVFLHYVNVRLRK